MTLKCLICSNLVFPNLQYEPGEKINWSVCKNCFGKELTDLQLQILANEVKVILLSKGINLENHKIVRNKVFIVEKEEDALDI